MPTATTAVPMRSPVLLGIDPSLVCYISTRVNTMETKSFQPTLYRNHYKGIRKISISLSGYPD